MHREYPNESVFGLDLLERVEGVVDEREADGAAAAELGAQTVDDDRVGRHLVHLRHLLAQLLLGHRRAARVLHLQHLNVQHIHSPRSMEIHVLLTVH